MDTERMIRELRAEAEKHKNDTVFTFQTRISDMCTDVANRLEELYSELSDYHQKKAEGRLVELPCEVGDSVYCVGEISCKQCEYSKNQTFNEDLKDINGEPIVDDCEEDCPVTVKETKFELWFIDDIGKEYFLTREEAEKALEREGE